MTPTVTISARGEERLHSGHPWIYRTDIKNAAAAAGDRVIVKSLRGGRPLGSAFYSDKSQIALRMLTRSEQPADDALISLGRCFASRSASNKLKVFSKFSWKS